MGGRGAAWVLGGALVASRTTATCFSSVPRKYERVIRIPFCHTNKGFFLGYSTANQCMVRWFTCLQKIAPPPPPASCT